MGIEPFRIDVAEEVLADLRARLGATRFPDQIGGAGWDYGAELGFMRRLAYHWLREFDWRAQEARLNALDQGRFREDGLATHFVHERGRGPAPLPLVLAHGWPSTCFEFASLIPLLVDPIAHGADAVDAFDVVVPSLPGYGFSDRPQAPGTSTATAASTWAALMTELGYERFGAVGMDVGGGVVDDLALDHPARLVGIHQTSVGAPDPFPDEAELTAAERRYFDEVAAWRSAEGGYGRIQRTKPQTLAYGLNDSPIGLAAWIVEKWRAWSDCGGDVLRRFTLDELLTTVTIYWVTETIGSSVRIYYESEHHPAAFTGSFRVSVPTAVALFPADLGARPPRELGERSYDIVRWTQMPRGGHFPALEEPELLAADIRAFFRPLR